MRTNILRFTLKYQTEYFAIRSKNQTEYSALRSKVSQDLRREFCKVESSVLIDDSSRCGCIGHG